MSSGRKSRPSVAFVHNYATHYNEGTFRLLAQQADVRFFFYSRGEERYWLPQHGVRNDRLPGAKYPAGFSLGSLRVAPTLPIELIAGRFDAIVSGINGKFALPAATLSALASRTPFVLWTGLWAWPDTPAHRLARPAVRAICRAADSVVVYGTHVQRFLVEQGVAPNRIFIEPHAVDNASCSRPICEKDRSRMRSAMGARAGLPVVLYVGRLEPEKGVEDLLIALRQMQTTAHLAIAGTGTTEGVLRRSIHEFGLADRVTFLGYVSTNETPALYAAADALVVPSVTTATFKEPWGLVVNEAFNQALPAVVTEAVGAAAGGLVVHEQTGLVVPERRPDLIARALDRILGNTSLHQRLAGTAKQRIEAWNQQEVANTFIKAIDAAISRGHGSRGKV